MVWIMAVTMSSISCALYGRANDHQSCLHLVVMLLMQAWTINIVDSQRLALGRCYKQSDTATPSERHSLTTAQIWICGTGPLALAGAEIGPGVRLALHVWTRPTALPLSSRATRRDCFFVPEHGVSTCRTPRSAHVAWSLSRLLDGPLIVKYFIPSR